MKEKEIQTKLEMKNHERKAKKMSSLGFGPESCIKGNEKGHKFNLKCP
jgi:hypothetical protein